MIRKFRIAAALTLAMLLIAVSFASASTTSQLTGDGFEVTWMNNNCYFILCTEEPEVDEIADLDDPGAGRHYIKLSVDIPKLPDNWGLSTDMFSLKDAKEADCELQFSFTRYFDGEGMRFARLDAVGSVPDDANLSQLTLNVKPGKDEAYSYNLGELASQLNAYEAENGILLSPKFSGKAQINGITLAIQPQGTFEALKEGKVLTRLGDTNLAGGATARAGSGLTMEVIRGSSQYSTLLVAFAYSPSAGLEADADALEAIAKDAHFTDGSTSYAASVAWVTDTLFCLAFSHELKGDKPLLCMHDGGALVIGTGEK